MVPTSAAWFIATYLAHPAAGSDSHPFALATLQARPAHRLPARGTDAWFIATYLGAGGGA